MILANHNRLSHYTAVINVMYIWYVRQGNNINTTLGIAGKHILMIHYDYLVKLNQYKPKHRNDIISIILAKCYSKYGKILLFTIHTLISTSLGIPVLSCFSLVCISEWIINKRLIAICTDVANNWLPISPVTSPRHELLTTYCQGIESR